MSRTAVPALAAVGLAAVVSAQSAAPLKLERKVELPDVQGRIDHLSIDARSRRLFVAALGNDTVEVIDLAAGRRTQTLRGLAEPQGVLVVPETNRLFVANGKDGTVRLFDASTLAPAGTVDLGDDADNLRLDAATGRVWAGYGDGALAAIDAKGARLATIPLAAHPESFQLETSGPRIFVNLPGAQKIAVVDRNKGAVIASWGTAEATANFPMALDEADKRLFVVCRRPARLLVLDTDSGKVVAQLPTVGDSDDVFYDASTRRLYVSGGEGAIVTYQQEDRDHYKELARTETARGARTSFFSPALLRFFLAVRRDGSSPAAICVYETAR